METKLVVEWGWDVNEASVLRTVEEITRCFPSLDHAIATIVRPAGGLPVSRGHRTWREEYLAEVPTPDGLPRRDSGEICPEGALLVEVDVIKGPGQPRPSMG